MAELTTTEVCQVLNKLSPDGTVYCLDDGVPGVDVELGPGALGDSKALIYVSVKSDARDGLYRVMERLSREGAVKRVSVILAMGTLKEE